ncbi:hypothetical protein D3C86_2149520 [compost metagenome]
MAVSHQGDRGVQPVSLAGEVVELARGVFSTGRLVEQFRAQSQSLIGTDHIGVRLQF